MRTPGASGAPAINVRKTILCIDDEVAGLQVRKMLLESSGYRVLTAGSGPEGLEIFSRQRADAVLLDYYMPGMNGGAVAEEMKRRSPDVMLILLSAYITVPEKTLDTVDAFVTKGQPPDLLLTKLDSLLRNEHRHPELAEECVVFVNAERRYTEVSDAVCRLLGYRRAELLGMGVEDLSLTPATAVKPLFSRELAGQSARFVLRHKSGHAIPVIHEMSVLADGCLVSRLTPVRSSAAAD